MADIGSQGIYTPPCRAVNRAWGAFCVIGFGANKAFLGAMRPRAPESMGTNWARSMTRLFAAVGILMRVLVLLKSL